MEAEEREVKALLVLDADDEGDALMDTDCEGDSEVSDGLEYVPDSEEDLLLSPRGLRSRSPL
jgi:hypothetical protein